MRDIEKKISKVLETHFEATLKREFKRANHAASVANWELYYGPAHSIWAEKKYFAALNRVARFKDKYLSELYVDLDCDYVSDKEPEGYTDEDTGEYVEPNVENTYKVEIRDVTRYLFGECAGYL